MIKEWNHNRETKSLMIDDFKSDADNRQAQDQQATNTRMHPHHQSVTHFPDVGLKSNSQKEWGAHVAAACAC